MRRQLFAIARSSLASHFIGWVFERMSFLIPVQRLRDAHYVIAFYHPKPSYAVHILIVPKKRIGRMIDLTETDGELLVEVFQVVRSLVTELALEERGYRLITNGGQYQDVPQLHFHLICET